MTNDARSDPLRALGTELIIIHVDLRDGLDALRAQINALGGSAGSVDDVLGIASDRDSRPGRL